MLLVSVLLSLYSVREKDGWKRKKGEVIELKGGRDWWLP